MPNVTVDYVSSSSTGYSSRQASITEEIWYDLGGKRVVGRATTTDGVLDAIYELAGIAAPQEGEAGHRGHRLPRNPPVPYLVFYVVWPLAVIGLGLFFHRRGCMSGLSRRDLVIAATGFAITPLCARRIAAAELRVDLSKERVGQPPWHFSPSSGHGASFRMPGQGGHVDGQPGRQTRTTAPHCSPNGRAASTTPRRRIHR